MATLIMLGWLFDYLRARFKTPAPVVRPPPILAVVSSRRGGCVTMVRNGRTDNELTADYRLSLVMQSGVYVLSEDVMVTP